MNTTTLLLHGTTRESQPCHVSEALVKWLEKMQRIQAERGTEPPPAEAAPDPERKAWAKVTAAGYPPAILDTLGNTDAQAVRIAGQIRKNAYLITLLAGAPGTGKTSIAALLALWRARRKEPVGQYHTIGTLARALNRYNTAEEIEKMHHAVQRSRWLVIDDLHRAPAWFMPELEELLVHRQEHYRPTLIISTPGHVRHISHQITTRAHRVELPWPPFR